MISNGARRYEAWLSVPVDEESGDPRYAVRRLPPQEFDRVYDLVDAAFGARRRRDVYDWLYRRNPGGPARCWAVLDRWSGDLLCAGARFPWPLALGGRALDGLLVGDLSVAPGRQRQGVADVRRRVRFRHPLIREEVCFGWPNEKSVRRSLTKGRDGEILGPFPEAVLPVRGGRLRAGALGRRLSRTLAAKPRRLRVVPLERFDATVAAVAAREPTAATIWSPRSPEFLNWRYFSHPTHAYRAFGLLDGEACRGYAVVRLDGRAARLMELHGPGDPTGTTALIAAARAAAGEAGQRQLMCFASPAWRQWAELIRAGFALRLGSRHLWVEAFDLPESGQLERWQLAPADADEE